MAFEQVNKLNKIKFLCYSQYNYTYGTLSGMNIKLKINLLPSTELHLNNKN